MSKLDIIVQGKMNRYYLGCASEEQFLEAEKIISSSGVDSSLEKLDVKNIDDEKALKSLYK